MRFWHREVCEIGSQLVDYGLDLTDFLGGRGTGIVGGRERFRVSRQILGVPGVGVVGDGYSSRIGILTVIFC